MEKGYSRSGKVKMGLITKAIKKVESNRAQPEQKQPPPQSGGKKKFVIFLAVLLVIGASLVFGYLSFMKSPSPPSAKPRRSISARRKPVKPPKRGPERRRDSVVTKQENAPPEKTLKKPLVRQNVAEDVETVDGGEKKAQSDEKKPSAPMVEKTTSERDGPSSTPEPGIKRESKGQTVMPPGEEGKTPKALEKEKGSVSQQMPDDNIPVEPERPPEKTTSSHAPGSIREMVQRPLTITKRSNSKARRYYDKGLAYQREGKFDQAIASYRKALNFDPAHHQARMNLATVYMHKGRFKEAKKELVYLYALRPRDTRILFNLALLLYQTGEYASAETKLKKLLELDPFHLEAALLLAGVYQERGEFDKAIQLGREAYRINSGDPRVLYQLGRAFDLAGDEQSAIRYYRLFLQTSSSAEEEKLKPDIRERLNYLLWRKEE